MKQRPLTTPRSTLWMRQSSAMPSRCSVASISDPGDAEHLAEHVGRAARQAGERRGGAEQAVGGLVDGAVSAEGDDHVVALVGGLAAELGRMAAGLGVARVDLEAAAQGMDDEVAQAVGDRRGVGVDDDQHALLGQGLRRARRRPHPVRGRGARCCLLHPLVPGAGARWGDRWASTCVHRSPGSVTVAAGHDRGLVVGSRDGRLAVAG